MLRMIMFVCVVLSATRITYSHDKMTEAEAKKERYACGARAAFALIRLVGQDATYSTVHDHFTLSEKGSSLSDVKSALLAHGVDCSILRLQLTELTSIPRPFIGHVARVREGSIDKGHFLIVTDVDERGVQTYDPVFNKTTHLRWRIFSDRWYGYVIVPTRTENRSRQFMTYAIGIHLLLVFLVVASLGRKMWSLLMKNLTEMRLFVTIFIMIVFGRSHPADAAASELLRSDSNDGANAAALLGGIYGVEIPPGRAGGTDSIDYSLRDIQVRLQTHGLAASVRLLSYDALASRNMPCVVPLRFANDQRSSFCVFIQANESEVYLVAAGPLRVQTVSVDDFRRYWTGYAVFGDGTDAHSGDLLIWAIFGCSIPLSGYGVFAFSRTVFRR